MSRLGQRGAGSLLGRRDGARSRRAGRKAGRKRACVRESGRRMWALAGAVRCALLCYTELCYAVLCCAVL